MLDTAQQEIILKLDARTLTRRIESHGQPVGWRDLVVLLDVSDSAARRELRNLLKGMVRSGELQQDHRGAYHVAERGGVRRGRIESSGMSLSFQGLALPRERRMVLRAGDEVSARIIGEDVHVLEVLARSEAPVIGIARVRGRYPYVESLSPDYKGKVSLIDPDQALTDGETVAVAIEGEERRVLTGRIIDHLGAAGGAAQAATTLLQAHGVPQEWDPGVDAQLDRLPSKVDPGRHADRLDLAQMPLVTIDGASARDFDDAVFAEKHRGGWRLVVAIADVAHYVKPGSALDRSAYERGNSVYLPDRVIPMLPEVLSNGLCSLNPQVPRMAMVCEMRISQAGKVTDYTFSEAVIRSWQRLTYERVQEFLDEGALDVEPEVSHSLRALFDVYQALSGARGRRGALDFETHEGRLELHDNKVKAIHPTHRLEAHKLIEEAMIAANVSAAEYIMTQFGPSQGMYRVHQPPVAEKLEQLRQAMALAGIRMPQGALTPLGVKAAMDQLAQRENRWLFEMMVLRSLTQAVYTPDNSGHFGLALEHYMHFTSPIRRYADLVVHRTIKAILKNQPPPYSTDQLVETGVHISVTERRAESVGWGVDAWLKCEYVAGRTGETFDGLVMGVTDFGLFVELKGYFIQGLLHISELGSDYFQFQPQSMSLVGERSGRRFTLGDELRVVLTDVIAEQGKLDLRLDKPAAGSAGRKGGGKGKDKGASKDRKGARKRGQRRGRRG